MAIEYIKKRDGTIVKFNEERITEAIWKAAQSVGGKDRELSKNLSHQVVKILEENLKHGEIPTVEQVQDLVEKVLVENGHYKTAKAYILYRELHNQIRELVDSYLYKKTWLIKENSNSTYSLQSLNFYVTSQIISKYWLHKIYKDTPEISEAHLNGDFHIHDLPILGPYCVGWDLRDLLLLGFGGVRGKITSKPAKHFRVALGQVVNFFFTLQGEAAGAQAFSFDGQTPITIKRNGNIESVTLEMLFDDYKHFTVKRDKSEVIFTENIYRRYSIDDADKRKYLDSRLPTEPILFQIDEIEVLTEEGFVPLKAISRHKIEDKNDELLIIETEDGNLLRITRSHPVILSNGSIKRADELKEGDELLSSHINIEVTERIRLHRDFAYLIGFMIAEGCWGHQTRDYSIVSQKKRAKEREKIERILKELQIPYFTNKEFNIVFGTTRMGRFIRNHLGLQAGSYRKNLPTFIFNLAKENIGDLISGIIDGDGDIARNRIVRISSTSYTLLMQLKQILQISGIHSTVRYVSYKNKKENYRDSYVIRFRIDKKNLSLFSSSIKLQNIDPKIKESPRFSSKVVKIINAKSNSEYVYDITTKNEHFLINDIVVHNSNFDTYLAPFIRYDNLNFKEVKQALQEFMFNLNVPTRVGFQSPFTNITLDLEVPKFMENEPVIVGGKVLDETYKDFQPEMDIFNQALAEVMLEGDGIGRVFTFPIPTINITKDFDFDNPVHYKIFETAAKYGIPYFANFINSDMNPEDVRSMCCHLRLDKRELKKRGGGLFGSNPLTGCYDDKTEILTENGWKLFKDLTKEERVFTLSEDNKIELQYPKRLFEYDYEGKMVCFKSKSLDLLVTPNHRMVVDHAYKNKRRFVEAKDFNPQQHRIPKGGIWEGEEKKYFELPSVLIMGGSGTSSRFSEEELRAIREMKEKGESIYKIAEKFDCNPVTVYNIYTKKEYGNRERTRIRYKTPPLKIKMDDWLKFFGFWLAEGSTDNEKIALDHGYRVIIAQVDKQKKREIIEVIDRLPFNYYLEGENCIVICNKQLWSYLRQFGNAYQKFIPKEIKNLSRRQLKILFDWMVKGDGYVRKNGQINYWTASKKLCDDLQEIILKLGWMGTAIAQRKKVSQIKGRKIKAGVVYNIGVQKTKHYRLRERNMEEIYYKGKVYCCEVPNHTLFVRRNGKVCWSGNSIGVVTINMPRIGYLSKDEGRFFERLENLMELAKQSLEIKREWIEKFTEMGLYPYSKFYLREIKKGFGGYWKNHFNTIGLVGMNEACLNFLGCTIADKDGLEFAKKVLDFMRNKLADFQEETGNIYNLEATPAEGSSYRLAKIDKEKYPNIIVANEDEVKKGAEPFYTNSTQLHVGFTDDLWEALRLQDPLQVKYTGGTVFHIWLGESNPPVKSVISLVKKVCENFKLPYFTLTPTFSICPIHGYIPGEHKFCPKCEEEGKKTECEVYSRAVGYLRPVEQWNDGKQEEFKQRKKFDKAFSQI